MVEHVAGRRMSVGQENYGSSYPISDMKDYNEVALADSSSYRAGKKTSKQPQKKHGGKTPGRPNLWSGRKGKTVSKFRIGQGNGQDEDSVKHCKADRDPVVMKEMSSLLHEAFKAELRVRPNLVISGEIVFKVNEDGAVEDLKINLRGVNDANEAFEKRVHKMLEDLYFIKKPKSGTCVVNYPFSFYWMDEQGRKDK